MDGKVESLMNSVALSMTIIPNFKVDCYVSQETFNQLTQYLVGFFSEDDSLPTIAHYGTIQVVLGNGAEINCISGGRSRWGRNPNLVVMDENDPNAEAYMTGAPVVALGSEDLRFV